MPDGSLKPRRLPNRDPSNPAIFVRPSKTERKGLSWDEINGVWWPF